MRDDIGGIVDYKCLIFLFITCWLDRFYVPKLDHRVRFSCKSLLSRHSQYAMYSFTSRHVDQFKIGCVPHN